MLIIQKVSRLSRHRRLFYLTAGTSALLICLGGFYGVRAMQNHSVITPSRNDTGEVGKLPVSATQQTTADGVKPPAGQKPKDSPAAAPAATKTTPVPPAPAPAAAPVASPPPALTYDSAILADSPVGYWTLSEGSAVASDKTSNNNSGTYFGSTAKTTLPNNDGATRFNGTTNTYAEIPDSDNYSITTTKKMTWEAWVRPDNLNFVNSTRGYINWMGKCHVLSPTCEWMARFYNLVNTQNRCNRFSAYAFNPTASFGSGAYWQPTCGLIVAGHWMHVVGEYQTLTTPSICDLTYPGTIDIWVNGIKWDQSYGGTTGCMSQYMITPVNNNSPIDIGTVSKDSWFEGAVGKLAIYNYQLSQSQITAHYKNMTGAAPSGSCAASCTLTNP